MSYNFLKQLGFEIKKQVHRLSNWSEYNTALRRRGAFDTYFDPGIVLKLNDSRHYDETGSTVDYSDFAILTCHEIRMVYKLPLQPQGLIRSIFNRSGLPISCPDCSILSLRLATLGIKYPKYTKRDSPDDVVTAIAIDSTDLKRFGRDE